MIAGKCHILEMPGIWLSAVLFLQACEWHFHLPVTGDREPATGIRDSGFACGCGCARFVIDFAGDNHTF